MSASDASSRGVAPHNGPTTRPQIPHNALSLTSPGCRSLWGHVGSGQGLRSAFQAPEPGLRAPPVIPRYDRLCYGVWRDQAPLPPPLTRAQGMQEGVGGPLSLGEAVDRWLLGPRTIV